jgi:hypothetical protein
MIALNRKLVGKALRKCFDSTRMRSVKRGEYRICVRLPQPRALLLIRLVEMPALIVIKTIQCDLLGQLLDAVLELGDTPIRKKVTNNQDEYEKEEDKVDRRLKADSVREKRGNLRKDAHQQNKEGKTRPKQSIFNAHLGFLDAVQQEDDEPNSSDYQDNAQCEKQHIVLLT